MSATSSIEWTDATWNPVTGCSKVSPGCAYCYAEALSLRFGHSKVAWTPANAAENVKLHPDRLDLPRHWKKPRRVFVNSMSDMFHELVPDAFIGRVWNVMAECPRHTFQVLTKRPERIARALGPRGCGFYAFEGPVPCPQPNVWIGTSIENSTWRVRLVFLRQASAPVRFLSCEPLLGPIPNMNLDGIHWVIVGGESGPHHRPMQADWARDIRDQCNAAGVAFFFKQWGGRTPKAGGRELDGREWNEMPGAVSVGETTPREER